MDINETHYEAAWGVKVNTDLEQGWSKNCPAWISKQKDKGWQYRGVVVWHQEQNLVISAHATDALKILSHSQTDDTWRQQGLVIRRPTLDIDLGELESRVVPNQGIQLDPTQAQHFLNVVYQHQDVLRRMAEDEAKEKEAFWGRVSGFHMRLIQQAEINQVDIAARPIPWTFDQAKRTWTCTMEPFRVTVCLSAKNLWNACLERPKRFKLEPSFIRLEKALAWAEKEILAAPATMSPPKVLPPARQRLTLQSVPADHRERLTPYWIEPSNIESKQITYRILLQLVHVPIRQQSLELSFGEKLYYDKEYPTAIQLLKECSLPNNALSIQGFGGLYYIESLMRYADEATVKAQAQQLWDRSSIAAKFTAKQVTSAAYGISEEETGYNYWMGWLGEQPDDFTSRASYMADQAFQKTLIHALDIDGCRAAMDFFKDEPNEVVLRWMHEQRAEAVVVPQAARKESQQWLKEHTQP